MNIDVLPRQGHPTPPADAEPEAPNVGVEGFQLVDAEGGAVGDPWATRGDAVRHMGSVALHGASLPLQVRGPDGRLTGDRLG